MTRSFLLTALFVSLVAGQANAQYPHQGYGYPPVAMHPVAQPMPGLQAMGPGGMPMGPAGPMMPFAAPGMAPSMVPAPVLAPAPTVLPAAFERPASAVLGGGDEYCGKGSCGKCGGCCLSGGFDRRLHVYGEFLYLRARDSEVAFAVPIDGPITPGTPRVEVGPVAVADQDFQPGARIGASLNTSECTQLTGEYTWFESSTTEGIFTSPPFVLLSMVEHPSVDSSAQSFLQANSRYDISFDTVDASLLKLIDYCDDYQLGVRIGVRYMQHEQDFRALFQGTGNEFVQSDIDFYGVGVRGGLEYEQYIGCRVLAYAKAHGSLIPGEFRASFFQQQSFDSRVVNTTWKAGRIVTIWDLELGLGVTSKCQNYRLSCGYLFSAWTNMVQTDEWIEGVHTNNFIDMDATSSFDGLIARFEARF